MGKTFGVSSKAQEGRERKAAQKEVRKLEAQKKKEEKEAQEWSVGVKEKSKKQLEEERKKEDRARLKAEKKRIIATEEIELEKHKPTAHNVLIKNPDTIGKALSSQKEWICSDEEFLGQMYSASNIDDALILLESTSSLNSKYIERHPERRTKAAYTSFAKREMDRLKTENPTLKRSQLLERIQILWRKAPENPFNQSHIHYNATKSEESLKATSEAEAQLERLRFTK